MNDPVPGPFDGWAGDRPCTIVDLDPIAVDLDLVDPLVSATGVHSTRTATLVRVELSDGSIGWGENVAPEGTFYTGESSALSGGHLREALRPGALGAVVTDPAAFELGLAVDDFPMARHAVASAVWDARCRAHGVPLAEALGGSLRPVDVCAVIGLADSPAVTAVACRHAVEAGYRHLKVKIAPGRDVAVVTAVRDAIGDAATLSVDANGAFTVGDIGTLARLGDLGVDLVEQPFSAGDVGLHAALVRERAVGVGLDESVMTRDDLMRALDAGACTAVNIKPARVGGFVVALGMVGICRDAGVDAWVGGMLETGIGRAGALALATHPAFSLPADLSASSRYFVRDLTEPFVLSDGRLSPRGPGIGVVPAADRLDPHC